MQKIADGAGMVTRYSATGGCQRRETGTPLDVAAAPDPALPDWLRTPGAAGEPSTAACVPPIPPTTTASACRPANRSQLRARALQRGTLVHRLLQSLPDIAAEAPRARPRSAISPAMPTTGPTPTASRWPTRCSP